MRLAWDLDGTLTLESEVGSPYQENYLKVQPNTKMIEHLRKAKNEGHQIVIFTARHYEDRRVTEQWLRKHDIPYDELILGKTHATVYIDDRAVHPNQIENLEFQEVMNLFLKVRG